MKKDKIIFWVCTSLVSIMMLFSAFGYFTNPDMKAAFVHLGFPDYFRVELGIAKILAVVALLLPMVPYKVKLSAYFGLAITFISASIAHITSGDPISMGIMPLVILGVLVVSYIYYHKINTKIAA